MLEFGMDRYVEALRRLLRATDALPAGTTKRRRWVASQAGCSADNLYQVAAGIPLKSGRPRSVGRDLAEKLDRAFPNWLDAEIHERLDAHDAVEAKVVKPPPLELALREVARAIDALNDADRAALRDDWLALLRAPDSPKLFSVVLDALRNIDAVPSLSEDTHLPEPQLTPEEIKRAKRLTDAAAAAHQINPVPRDKQRI